MQDELKKMIRISTNRISLCINIVNRFQFQELGEIGVYKGVFAEKLLTSCESINNYYMIDPWRNIEDWNKPANVSDSKFESYFKETLNKTEIAKEKRIILRGKTTEVINHIPDNSLDFLYIDGDHTLKGISIDLICAWDKIKPGGFIVGDDFCDSIWQHGRKFEPTAVFPFALYFAEGMDVKIYSLPFNQFLISKEKKGFEFINLTTVDYSKTSLLEQLKNFPQKSESNFLKSLFRKISFN